MAYFCFSVIALRAPPGKGNGIDRAATMLRVDGKVPRNLSELSSTRGDAKNARKALPVEQPLTREGTAWLEATIKTLIRRVGELSSSRPLPEITIGDLPEL